MSAFVKVDCVEEQPGTFRAEGEKQDRQILNIRGVIIDVEDARRLADHYHSQQALGRDPLASECREIAAPIMAALVAAGFCTPQ